MVLLREGGMTQPETLWRASGRIPSVFAGWPHGCISTGTPNHGIIAAYAGTYSVEGNKVTHHIVASWFPEWIGGDQIRYAEIEGD
jgi:hypothetical protein